MKRIYEPKTDECNESRESTQERFSQDFQPVSAYAAGKETEVDYASKWYTAGSD
ncbi:hypothetical protein J4466_01685 [Candidatus Pacearchaeota archaeon]|nr:hypothetical protein [Candidatus Pacearchaeota archaeon]